jgi:hypothetical protein
MSPLIKRERPDDETPPATPLAALISTLEDSAAAMREGLSPQEIREAARERARSQGEAWKPIRGAARTSGKR